MLLNEEDKEEYCQDISEDYEILRSDHYDSIKVHIAIVFAFILLSSVSLSIVRMHCMRDSVYYTDKCFRCITYMITSYC